MRRRVALVAGISFVFGNVLWDKFGWYEPKIMYVPLALFLWLLIYEVIEPSKLSLVKPELYFWRYLFALSIGNIIKQVFYSETIEQINDYIWGGLVTLILLIFLVKWAIQKQQHGKKSRRDSARF